MKLITRLHHRLSPVGAFFSAIRLGRTEDVREMLDRGSDPEARAGRGDSALMCAACHGRRGVVALLVERGADPVGRSSVPWSEECFRHVLSIRYPQNGFSCLEAMALSGQSEMLAALLALLEGRPRPLVQEVLDNALRLALSAATRSRKLACATLLVEHGARLEQAPTYLAHEALSAGNAMVLQRVLELGGTFGRSNYHTPPPVYCAAVAGHAECIKVLAAAGYDLHQDPGGEPPLTQAAERGHFSAVNALLEAGSRIPRWALEYTVLAGHFAVAQLLVEHGAALEESDHYLVQAIQADHAPAVQFFLDLGVDVNLVASVKIADEHISGTDIRERMSLLRLAEERGANQVARLLRSRGASESGRG